MTNISSQQTDSTPSKTGLFFKPSIEFSGTSSNPNHTPLSCLSVLKGTGTTSCSPLTSDFGLALQVLLVFLA